jgi:hypothetical protein
LTALPFLFARSENNRRVITSLSIDLRYGLLISLFTGITSEAPVATEITAAGEAELYYHALLKLLVEQFIIDCWITSIDPDKSRVRAFMKPGDRVEVLEKDAWPRSFALHLS